MNISETIQQKVFHLPPKAQEEALEAIEQIEEKYIVEESSCSDVYPLAFIYGLATDVGVTDFAERHKEYSNRMLED